MTPTQCFRQYIGPISPHPNQKKHNEVTFLPILYETMCIHVSLVAIVAVVTDGGDHCNIQVHGQFYLVALVRVGCRSNYIGVNITAFGRILPLF